MKKYPKYKPSGIELVGEIPEHWNVLKLKYSLKALESGSRQTGGGNIGDGVFSIGGEHIGWLGELLLDNQKYISEEYYENLKNGKVIINDVLLVKDGATIGKCAILKNLPFEKCAVNEHVFILRVNEHYVTNYLFYFIWCNIGQEQILFNIRGSAQPGLNSNFINEVFIPRLSKEEQTVIANFLDKKTAQIDKLITNKQKLIELLKEERTAIINQAVTRGINTNVKLKPSGIDWLGDIPKHWEVKKLKYAANINPSNRNYIFSKDSDEEVIFLPMEKVSENGTITQDVRKKISEVSTGFTYFEKDDVIVAKITPCFENGKGALLTNLETNFGFGSTEFHTIRALDNIKKQFLFYLIKSERFMTIGEAFMMGSAGQKRVPTDFVKEFIAPLPPLDEQSQIVQHIEIEANRIDNTISKIEKEIELLQEYRTALISEVVTGQIMVI